MQRAILFDLDGTLLDTAPEFLHCLNLLLHERQQPLLTLSHFKETVSKGAMGMIQYAFGGSFPAQALQELKQQFLSLYQSQLGSKTQYFDGIESVLRFLIEQSIPWGIVTNKPKLYSEPLISQFPLLTQAHCLISGDSLEHCKPHPLPLLHGCKYLRVAPQSCWYVGDALSDVLASQNAKLLCALAGYGYLPSDHSAKTWPVNKTLNKPLDILSLFQNRLAN